MSQPTARPGLLTRAWVRLVGESDPIERQLTAIAREGAMLARIAHLCAFLMLILFSAGSLVALAGDSLQAIANGRATFPDIIAASVSGLLVACMDTAMLYAASILRLLAVRRAAKEEGRLHRFVLFSVAILEAGTYGYMSWRYEHPADIVAWALIAARALAAPLLSVYLSLARPLPVMARDMLALGERIAGEGVLRDLAHIAGDASASLVEKVGLYIAAAVIAPDDATRLQALLDVAQQREQTMKDIPSATLPLPAPSSEATDGNPRPPTGPGSPARKPRQPEPVLTPAANVTPMRPPRKRKPRQKRAARGSVEPAVRAVFTSGMGTGELMRLAGVSKAAASKWRKVLQTEADAASSQENQAVQ
jgi:hypothetical protein